MIRDSEKLLDKFNKDTDRIAMRNIKLCGLKFSQDIQSLSEPLHRWMDFVLRYIPPRPRKVIFAKGFSVRAKSAPQDLIQSLVLKIAKGADINCYQSTGLIYNNDSSGSKRAKRSDLLWADWGIHHLHLSKEIPKPGKFFTTRSDWLLYALFSSDVAAIIDVKHHKIERQFADKNMIALIIESWPEYMENFELKSIVSCNDLTPAEISIYRRSGIMNALSIGGKSYMGPGQGVNTASTSNKVMMESDKLRYCICELAKLIGDSTSVFRQHIEKFGIDSPIFSLELTERGIAVYEKNTDTGYLLSGLDKSDRLSLINDRLNPSWLTHFENSILQTSTGLKSKEIDQ